MLRTNCWADELRDAYRDPLALLRDLELDAATVGLSSAALAAFPFRVTRAFASRMQPGDPRDPLLLQVLPGAAETLTAAGYSDDPVGEFGLGNGSNLLHKYAGRALLLMTGACAINCRYCFRRAYPYSRHVGQEALAAGLRAIGADTSLSEVILSGGDPLLLDDKRLARTINALSEIGHVKRLRIHTRTLVVLPSRVTTGLLEVLAGSRLATSVVIHSNHPAELDATTLLALQRLRQAGIVTLNQSVLLRGVNDRVETLAALSERLFSGGVLPYYVHLLDRVSGTAHFAVDGVRAAMLEDALRERLPGYLVPRFVREIAGEVAKTPLKALPSSAAMLDHPEALT